MSLLLTRNDQAPDAEWGELVNAILREFQLDRRHEDLRLLLHHESDHVVEAGIWIAAELGVKSRPLLEDIASLLVHTSKRVRFYAIDSILSASTPQDASLVIKVFPLFEDAEAAIRWKVMDFMARISDEHLESLHACITADDEKSFHAKELSWLRSRNADKASEVCRRVESAQPLQRMYGAIAAAREVNHNESVLRVVAASPDEVVSDFAREVLLRREATTGG